MHIFVYILHLMANKILIFHVDAFFFVLMQFCCGHKMFGHQKKKKSCYTLINNFF